MGLSIPLKNTESGSSSWWAWTYSEILDSKYDLYNLRLLNYNIPDAWNDWIDDSQAHWWLAWLAERHSQNDLWQDQYAVSTKSWTWPLEMFSRTHNFTSNIKTLDDGQVYARMYWDRATDIWVDWTDSVHIVLDDINKRISTTSNMTWELPTWNHFKAYLIQSWANWYNVTVVSNVLKTYPANSDWEFTDNVAIDTYTFNTPTPLSVTWGFTTYPAIAWVNDNYVHMVLWFVLADWAGSSTHKDNYCEVNLWWAILQVASDWIFSLIDEEHWIENYMGTFYTNAVTTIKECWINCYQTNNTSRVIFDMYSRIYRDWGSSISTARTHWYMNVDLTATSNFTYSNEYEEWASWGNPWRYHDLQMNANCWYDGTYMYAVDDQGDIIQASPSDYGTDTTSDFFMSHNYPAMYWNSLGKLTTQANNISIDNNKLNIKWTEQAWTSTGLYQNTVFVRKMTGSNEEDDAIICTHINTVATPYVWDTEDVKLELMIDSWTTEIWEQLLDDIWSIINPTTTWWDCKFDQSYFTWHVIEDIYLKFRLSTTNPNSRSLKLWFWLYWWSYDAPTWWNHFSESAWVWTKNSNSTYMDITL